MVPPLPARRRGVVPGLLGARAPVATSRRSRAAPCAPTAAWRVTGQKVWTSLAQYADRCVLLTRTGTVGVRPPRHHRVLRRHGHAGHHRRGRSRRCTASTSSRGVLRRRRSFRSSARSAKRATGLGVRDGPAAVRAQHVAVAAGRVPPSPVAGARRRRPRRRCSIPTRSARSRNSSYAFRARSRATQHRLAAGEPLGAETSIDKVLLATAEQAMFDLPRTRCRPRSPSATIPRASGGEPSSCTREPPRSTAAPPRSSATSSPGACSIWGAIADARRGSRALRAEPAPRDRNMYAVRRSTPRSTELGWHDALAMDTRAAVSLLFELQGAANATSSALTAVVARALGLPPRGLERCRAPGDRGVRRTGPGRRRPADGQRPRHRRARRT